MFLDPILKVLRAPLDLLRGKQSAVNNVRGGIKGDIGRVKNLGGEYGIPKRKKMGLFGKKKDGEGQAPAPVVQAQAQGGRQRTVALDMGAPAAGGTNVGWLVPLEGAQAGELFTLKARTIVGTAPDCDVVLNDGSISGRHAEFVLAGGGFRVTDLGSTNGTYVNDKRVSSHDLVDNDNVRLGRTNFKFKSMN